MCGVTYRYFDLDFDINIEKQSSAKRILKRQN